MFDFVAIDFETAHRFFPCSLGIAVVKNSQIELVKNWLIKPICYPYFHFYAQKIHGIKKKDVECEPFFGDLWQEIKPFLENTTLVAHNADFDMNVLRKTLYYYKQPIPKNKYYCTYQIARQLWKESPKFSLDFLCNQEKIEFVHHKSDQDAIACAKLFLRELELLEVNSFSELKTKQNIASKRLQALR
jgi:DNA polymerase-3 subunit epsilon